MFIPVKLDKTRNLRYGMKAIHRIENHLNTRIQKLNMDELSQYELAVFIWAGLVHEDSELTPDIVMDLIDEHSSIPVIAEAMGKAFEEAFGGNDEKKKKTPTSA